VNESILQTLVRLVTGRELRKLCPNCRAPAANFSLEGAGMPNPTNTLGSIEVKVWVGCDSCSKTLALFSLDDLLGALNDTL
jgi:hypothetical protein